MKTLKIAGVLGCGMALLLAGQVALAEEAGKSEPKGKPGQRFAGMDKNGDGGISLEELIDARVVHITEWFHRADADGDGSLSPQEMRRAHHRQRQMMRPPRGGEGEGDGPGDEMDDDQGGDDKRGPMSRKDRMQRSGPAEGRGHARRPPPPPVDDDDDDQD